MKIIVERATSQVKYAFPDDAVIDVQPDRIICPLFIVRDLNITNAMLFEGISELPSDYTGCKYLFVNGAFVINPEWREPEQ